MGERLRGRAGQRARSRRLARTNGLCERCAASGIVREAEEVNHKIALAHGGEDVDENTENLCQPCHKTVTADQFGHRIVQAIGEDGWPLDPSTGGSDGQR